MGNHGISLSNRVCLILVLCDPLMRLGAKPRDLVFKPISVASLVHASNRVLSSTRPMKQIIDITRAVIASRERT